MYEVTKNKAFYSTLRALRMLGLYPKRKKGAYFYLHVARMALERTMSFIITIGVCILHVGNAWGNEQIDISEDFAIICGGLGASMTNLLFGCRISNWSKFFLRINNFRKFGTPATYNDTINRLNFYSTSYFWYCTIGMGVYASVAVYESKECRSINEQYGLHDICWSVTPIWLPLNHIPGYLKVIIFMMQCIGSFLIVASAALICFLTWEATEVLLTHVKHLKQRVLEVFDDVDNATEHLGVLVEYHKFIFSVADQLNQLVQATVGHVSLVAALVFGCIGNQIFKSKPLGASAFLAGWVISMFMICHAGQKIRDESLSVADAIYFSEWYRGTIQQKKHIAFMIFRSQKPIIFDALPFGTLNYPLFVMIIKTSYSYLTLLNQST